MTIEMIIGAIVAVIFIGVIYYNRSEKDLDINNDGKVDAEDLKAAVDNAKVAAKADAEKVVTEVKKVAKKVKKKVAVNRMNKADLLAHAKKQGAKVDQSMTKKQILDALKNK